MASSYGTDLKKYIIYTISKIFNFEIITDAQKFAKLVKQVQCILHAISPHGNFLHNYNIKSNQDFDIDTMCVYNFISFYHLCRFGYSLLRSRQQAMSLLKDLPPVLSL